MKNNVLHKNIMGKEYLTYPSCAKMIVICPKQTTGETSRLGAEHKPTTLSPSPAMGKSLFKCNIIEQKIYSKENQSIFISNCTVESMCAM